jgi:membrane-associated phospholipid phosphatase
MIGSRQVLAAIALAGSTLLWGCGTLPNGRGWGEDATLWPGWERLRAAAVDAARDPWVWAPLVGAAVLQIDDWDRRVSNWARKQTPVFGSQANADDWSDGLLTASAVAHYATLFATPSGTEARDWGVNKTKGALVQIGAVGATALATRSLKRSIDRERPDGSGSDSFPSAHASASAVHTRLASRNLRSIELTERTRLALGVGLDALAIGTSWARVEAGRHFPADTLAGMALGNFIGSFVNDAFLGLEAASSALFVSAARDGAVVRWRLRF